MSIIGWSCETSNVPFPAEESERVVGQDGKSYPAKKEPKEKPEVSSENTDQDILAIECALYCAFHRLPETIFVNVKDKHLVITSDDPDKPFQHSIPLYRSTDWQSFPARACFTFTEAEWRILEDDHKSD